MQSKTFYTTGIGEREIFDNVSIVLSDSQCLELISKLSATLSKSDRHHFSFQLYGRFDDEVDWSNNKVVALVK